MTHEPRVAGSDYPEPGDVYRHVYMGLIYIKDVDEKGIYFSTTPKGRKRWLCMHTEWPGFSDIYAKEITP